MLKKKKKSEGWKSVGREYCSWNLLSKLLDWQYWNAGKERQYSPCVEKFLSFFYNATYPLLILKDYLGKCYFITPMDKQQNFLVLEKWKYIFLLLQLKLSEQFGLGKS